MLAGLACRACDHLGERLCALGGVDTGGGENLRDVDVLGDSGEDVVTGSLDLLHDENLSVDVEN